MGLLGHLGGQLTQYAANVDQALGNQSGANNLRNVSTAMRDPNMVYTGGLTPSGLLASASDSKTQFAPVSQPGGVQGNVTSQGNTQNQSPNNGAYAGDNGLSPSDYLAQQNALFSINSGITNANDALGRLQHQQDIGLGNLNQDYHTQLDQLTGQQRKTAANYQANQADQLNQYEALRNQNATAARNYLVNARQQLGAIGAGGGSAARYGVPYQAQQQAAQANSQAQQTNNHNIQALLQTYNDAKDQYVNAQNDLKQQLDQGRNDVMSKIDNSRATLDNTLLQLTGQQAIANGGDYKAALAAAQPYTAKVKGILDAIDSYSIAPKLAAQQVTVGRPDLSNYNFAQPGATPQPVQDPTLGAQPNTPVIVDPYSQDQQKQNPILALFGLDNNQQQQYA